jgi:hypothetical protein
MGCALERIDVAKEDCHSLAATDTQTGNTKCLGLLELDKTIVQRHDESQPAGA